MLTQYISFNENYTKYNGNVTIDKQDEDTDDRDKRNQKMAQLIEPKDKKIYHWILIQRKGTKDV